MTKTLRGISVATVAALIAVIGVVFNAGPANAAPTYTDWISSPNPVPAGEANYSTAINPFDNSLGTFISAELSFTQGDGSGLSAGVIARYTNLSQQPQFVQLQATLEYLLASDAFDDITISAPPQTGSLFEVPDQITRENSYQWPEASNSYTFSDPTVWAGTESFEITVASTTQVTAIVGAEFFDPTIADSFHRVTLAYRYLYEPAEVTEPTDPEPTDPDPTDPDPTDPDPTDPDPTDPDPTDPDPTDPDPTDPEVDGGSGPTDPSGAGGSGSTVPKGGSVSGSGDEVGSLAATGAPSVLAPGLLSAALLIASGAVLLMANGALLWLRRNPIGQQD